MTVLILTGDRNVKRADFTHVFLPESERFAQLVKPALGPVMSARIDVSVPLVRRAAQALTEIEKVPDGSLRCLAIFSHGWPRGCQVGFDLTSVKTLATVLARKAQRGSKLVVALYCCSTASFFRSIFGRTAIGGDGGFADALRDALCQAGCTDCAVYGHDTVGHATENPYVRVFEGLGSPVGGHGGAWIVAPRSDLWRRWRVLLANPRRSDLRLRFPFESVAEIHDEVAAA